MSIAPIRKSVIVKPPPARAFELFAAQMGRWWPPTQTPAKNRHVDVIVEPRAGGRWFERDAEGRETLWGEVLAYEPPERLLLGWRLNAQFVYDPDFLTEVEIAFAAAPGGGTEVRLEHRHLERFGAEAERIYGLIDKGWPARLAEFQQYAEQAQ
jgi:uncharacterized protein YndB with AHSA1/START domain